jgi:hypothetical protein
MKKPSFCGSCGQPFVGVSKASKSDVVIKTEEGPSSKPAFQPRNTSRRLARLEEEEEDLIEEGEGEDAVEVPNINKLSFEVERQKPRKQTIGDLMSSGGPSKKERREGGVVVKTKKQRKEFLEQFAKEAGSLRRK